jgi:hypothetical protein
MVPATAAAMVPVTRAVEWFLAITTGIFHTLPSEEEGGFSRGFPAPTH